MDNDRPQAKFNSQPSKHVAILIVENIILRKHKTQKHRWDEPSRVKNEYI